MWDPFKLIGSMVFKKSGLVSTNIQAEGSHGWCRVKKRSAISITSGHFKALNTLPVPCNQWDFQVPGSAILHRVDLRVQSISSTWKYCFGHPITLSEGDALVNTPSLLRCRTMTEGRGVFPHPSRTLRSCYPHLDLFRLDFHQRSK